MRAGTYYRYELLKKLGIFKNVKKESKILDIGGFDGFTLSKLNGSKKVLIDPDARKISKDIIYLKNDFFKYKFKRQRFDFIFSLDVLEHVPKEKEFEYFSKIYLLLEKKGVAIITTPSKDIKTCPNFLRRWIGRNWGHYKCLGYSKEELKVLLAKNNIKNYEIYSYHSRYYLNLYLLTRFLQIFLPENLFQKLLLKIANKDAKLDENISRGYYFIRILK